MYTTLARVKAEINGTEAYKASGTDQQIMGYIRMVTERIRAFRFEFEPLFYTRALTPTPQNVNSRSSVLTLGDALLEPTAISVGGVSVSYGSDILAYPNQGMTPIYRLRIATPFTGPLRTWYPINLTPDGYWESITVAGFWGMREYYGSQGFFDSTQTCPALNATQTTFTLTNVDGADAYGRTPEFSAGNLIRIENELMEVQATDTTTNVVTVIRGARGTTAVGHAMGLTIKIWEVEPDIVNAATRQSGLLLARRGAYMNMTTYPDGITLAYPSDLLAEIKATVQRFNYVGVW